MLLSGSRKSLEVYSDHSKKKKNLLWRWLSLQTDLSERGEESLILGLERDLFVSSLPTPPPVINSPVPFTSIYLRQFLPFTLEVLSYTVCWRNSGAWKFSLGRCVCVYFWLLQTPHSLETIWLSDSQSLGSSWPSVSHISPRPRMIFLLVWRYPKANWILEKKIF